MEPRRLPIAPLLLLGCAVLGSAGVARAADRMMFITSDAGPGNLRTWPGSGSTTDGLQAGDAICQARAAAAGLAHPGDYRAWLSTPTTDAYCHVQGLDGKRSGDCGLPGLPNLSGPWKRVDGAHFGATIIDLLAETYVAYLPPWLDENGQVVHALAWTGTDPFGAYSSSDCSDWKSSSGSATGIGGGSEYTGYRWAELTASACSSDNHLYCFQVGGGDPLPTPANWGRLAFVTSAGGSGDLSSWPQAGGRNGVAAGNEICRSLATAAGLTNADSFKAWLSIGGLDARDRFANDGPWMRLDRVRVASSLAQLTDGFLHAPINLTETGQYLGDEEVWTGTDADGTVAPARCNGWTSSSSGDSGQEGSAVTAGGYWSDYGNLSCDHPANHLYCLQDLPLIFGDDFESGSLAVWSSATP